MITFLIVYVIGFILATAGCSRVNHDGIEGIRFWGWVLIVIWPITLTAFLCAAISRILGV